MLPSISYKSILHHTFLCWFSSKRNYFLFFYAQDNICSGAQKYDNVRHMRFGESHSMVISSCYLLIFDSTSWNAKESNNSPRNEDLIRPITFIEGTGQVLKLALNKIDGSPQTR